MSARDAASFPDANYVFVTSRLHPGRDGGYTVAVLRRAAQFREFGGAQPLLLTVDLTPDYDEHRAGFVELGLADDATVIRNLFEDAVADPSWLWNAADPSITETTTDTDDHAAVSVTLRTPSVPRPDWHRTTAPLLALRDGSVVGGFEGFGGLYRAWVRHVIAGLDSSRPTVLIAESRQVGELLTPLRSTAPGAPEVSLVHTVHSAHTLPPHEWDSPVDTMWGGWLDMLGDFDAVVFPTAAQRDDVARRFGRPTHLEAIPHALTPAVETLPRDDAGASDSLTVAMVTRLVPLKRVDHVIRSIAALRERGVDARLDVYGDGPERAALEQLAADLGITDRVALHGHVSDPTARVATADVSVLTSTYEGQSLVVLESLLVGVPVVAYDVNYGPAEMIVHGENGVLVPSGDNAALTVALAQVLENAALRERFAAHAPRIAELFGPEPVMRRWAALLTNLLG